MNNFKLLLNYNSPAEINSFLEKHKLSPQKKFGQNFLISKEARENIIKISDLKENTDVWEIGPGLGAMTALIIEKLSKCRLTVFEIDRGFILILKELFGSSIEIAEGDFLKTWKSVYRSSGKPDRIIGNLPYNSASAIIASIIEANSVPEKMVFTVQKEAARRIAASPGTKDYSSFSVLCQIACKVKIETDISGGAFYPVPEVISSVISMSPNDEFSEITDRKDFSRFLRILFTSRRKTLLNNLKKEIPADRIKEILEKEKISFDIRAEKLTPQELVSLYKEIKKPD